MHAFGRVAPIGLGLGGGSVAGAATRRDGVLCIRRHQLRALRIPGRGGTCPQTDCERARRARCSICVYCPRGTAMNK